MARCSVIGVDNVFAVYVAYYHRTGRSVERDIRDGKRDTRTDHSVYFGRNIGVYRKRGSYHANVVEHTLRKERTDRAVDKARRKNGFIACSAFSAFERSGDLTHRVHLLFEVYAERKEIHTGTRLGRHIYVSHNYRIAASDDTRTVTESAVLAYFDGHFSSADCRFENF